MKIRDPEQIWDQRLNISTVGSDALGSDIYHYPYEPTPYCVLQRLVERKILRKEDCVVDYGCGKGRVGFFLRDTVGCRVVGVEYDRRIWEQAEENRLRFRKQSGIRFVCCNAETYLPSDANVFYFFNPFSVELLKSVLGQILRSYYEDPRSMRLLFYYPNDLYVTWLMNKRELSFCEEIDCSDLFPGENPRERILVFSVDG